MKKLYLLLLSITISLPLFSQDDIIPPTINIEGLQPKWLYISEDSAFVHNGLLASDTKYSLLLPNNIFETSVDHLLIIERSRTQSPGGGVSGQNYHSIDRESGQARWIKHINHWQDYDHRESTFYQSNQLKGEIVQSLTFRDLDTIDLTYPSFGFFGAPVLRKIDVNTGEMLTELMSSDTIRENHTAVGNGFERILNCGDDCYMSVMLRTEVIEDTLVDRLYFYGLDENLSRSESPIYIFTNNTEIRTQLLSLSYGIAPYQYDDTTIMISHHKINPAKTTLAEKRSNITFLTVADTTNIRELSTFSTQMPHPQLFQEKFDRFDILVDNEIFSFDLMESITGEISNVVNWWSPEGVNKFTSDNLEPEQNALRTIRPLKIINNELYLAACTDSRELNQKVYILKIKPFTNEAEIVKTIDFKTGEDYSSLMWQASMMDNGDIILGMIAIDYTLSDNSTRFMYYYCFDGADLGIISSTEDGALEQRNTFLKVNPNPVNNIMQIESEAELDGQLVIMDISGQTKMTVITYGGNEHQWNISQLPPGQYFLQFRDRQRVNSTVTKFVKI